jgi:hypothetical protein
MRAKLALIAAAAAVFAPGWQVSDVATGRSVGAELAVRILALTFDEASAASQSDRGTHKRLDRGKAREVSSKGLVWQGAASQLPSLVQRSHAGGTVLLAGVAGLPSTRAPRAPPHFVTV